MRVRRFVLLLLCVLLVLSAPIGVFAQNSSGNTTEVTNEKKYDPLDLVVVLDSSGSMTSSDKQRTAISAVRMLVNMMPADSRVAVISFNTQPTVKTTNAGGKPALISLEAFANVETVRDAVDSIVYKGKTGIGNAVKAATDLLAEQGMPGRTKAIMVFTDGVNEFGSSALAQKNLADCEGNEVDAIQWAKENDTVIYCVGYNYKNSMGKNGEGLQKLSNMADQTGGKVRAITKVEEIQPLLVEFLADVCDLVYVPVGTIPGDGGFHECRIPVSPSVVEANIRIAGGNANSIKKGEIHLYDPSGNEVKLQNSGNVRFDVDANAASIKVVLPKPGEWLLTVNGIEGEDIHIGLLEHFKMNLNSTLVFPEGNPTGVAYSNDVIGIRSWLTYDGAALTDAALYDAVTSATATFISRANPEDKQVVTLTRDGMAFTGSFRIPADAYYDVLVRLDWDTVYREDTLTVKSNNKPPELKNEIADVKVNKGKTITLTDIYQYVYDDEGDPITASISFVSSPDAADVTLDANAGSITINGKKWSSTLVTVQYKDNMGNVVESTFEVEVNDPKALALIIAGIVGLVVLIAAGVILTMWISKRLLTVITGEIRFTLLAEGKIDDNGKVQNTNIIYVGKREETPEVVREKPDTLGGLNDPFAMGSGNPFDLPGSGSADPFGAAPSDPFGSASADPFGSVAPAASGNPFDVSGGASDFSANPFAETTGGEKNPFSNPWDPDHEEKVETPEWMLEPDQNGKMRSKYDEKDVRAYSRFEKEWFALGKSRKAKNLLEIFRKFPQMFEEEMSTPEHTSGFAGEVANFISRCTILNNVIVTGTFPNGAFGVILKVKRAAREKIVLHNPAPVRGKVAWNPKQMKNKKIVAFSISVPFGEKKEDHRQCLYIKGEYRKL